MFELITAEESRMPRDLPEGLVWLLRWWLMCYARSLSTSSNWPIWESIKAWCSLQITWDGLSKKHYAKKEATVICSFYSVGVWSPILLLWPHTDRRWTRRTRQWESSIMNQFLKIFAATILADFSLVAVKYSWINYGLRAQRRRSPNSYVGIRILVLCWTFWAYAG